MLSKSLEESLHRSLALAQERMHEFATLEHLLLDFQVVIASIFTAAALEAYSTGLSIITILDDDDFNFSPLRGVDYMPFASTSEELQASLMQQGARISGDNMNDFFWTDPELPRWKNLLKLKKN